MSKFTYTPKGLYSEIGQPNPIRWCLLSGTPETGFVNESSWLKCKDFFNDYVVAYNGGQRFGIYGFSTEKMVIPAKGEPVYMAVKDLTQAFLPNLNVLNGGLPNPVEVLKTDDGTVVLKLPSFYLESTYNISLISLMIRLCNIAHTFSNYEEYVNYKQHASQDQNLWNTVVSKGVFFNLPEELQGYVWYAGEEYNDKKFKGAVYQMSSLVHNGGVIAWSKYFNKAVA
jgi:hypothetical protein